MDLLLCTPHILHFLDRKIFNFLPFAFNLNLIAYNVCYYSDLFLLQYKLIINAITLM